MLGIAVLMGLLFWIAITLSSAFLGGKLTQNLGWGKWPGRLFGFMLLMGGWFVYWAVEYWAVRQTAKEICKDAGITVYITPEEWRAKIGEEEWKKLKPVQERIKDGDTLLFEGDEYKSSYRYNDMIISYINNKNKNYINI